MKSLLDCLLAGSKYPISWQKAVAFLRSSSSIKVNICLRPHALFVCLSSQIYLSVHLPIYDRSIDSYLVSFLSFQK